MENPTSPKPTTLVAYVQSELRQLADPKRATQMQAYMKTAMPFYGVHTPDRRRISRQAWRQFPISSHRDYLARIRQLWGLAHREEKYIAIDIATHHTNFITSRSLGLYRSMILTGAWWDFVDPIATHLLGPVLLEERHTTRSTLDEWISDDSLWLRRAALLAHNRHKQRTDWRQLSRHCLVCAADTEFFIRKAIGWALREYSYSQPQRVAAFLCKYRERFSPLSFREGAKALVKAGFVFD